MYYGVGVTENTADIWRRGFGGKGVDVSVSVKVIGTPSGVKTVNRKVSFTLNLMVWLMPTPLSLTNDENSGDAIS